MERIVGERIWCGGPLRWVAREARTRRQVQIQRCWSANINRRSRSTVVVPCWPARHRTPLPECVPFQPTQRRGAAGRMIRTRRWLHFPFNGFVQQMDPPKRKVESAGNSPGGD